ncbi:hypothetical protein [Streptomyces sp. NBC_01497]|uniref:hypothetical protein n=1 Tax=Streptomyces sp. NBC_01497 TaxID=2903885 RepID=UPI002E32D284|nr:hypothetical protein [Streptomyces sp. NBC_01497]
MYRTIHARRPLALAGAALLVALGAVITAPAASAAPAADDTTLTVNGPAAVGFAGAPVEFTETIGNTGATAQKYGLALDAIAGDGVPSNGLLVDYRGDDGSWKRAPLDYADGEFSGLLPLDIPVAPAAARTVHLRIGLPMGEPHHGDSNGGTDAIRLTSSVTALDGSWVAKVRDTRTIAVESPSEHLAGVPETVVAGGKPARFSAVLTNGTPSRYENLGHVLFTGRHTTVRVLRDGVWTTLPGIPLGTADPDEVGHYLAPANSSLAAGATTTTPVRVSWDSSAPLGSATLRTCVYVNEATPFHGTTMCGSPTTVTVLRAGTGTTKPSPSSSASAPGSSATPSTGPSATSGGSGSPSPSADASASGPVPGTSPSPTPSATVPLGADARLASTGSNGKATLAACAGAALLLLGGGALTVLTRRGRRHRA